MSGSVVAKIWWEAPHEGELERFMFGDEVLTFGRGGECSIRVGYAPVYQPQVPRVWGEISFHRGSVLVHNLSPRWGFKLVPAAGSGSSAWIDVPPKGGASSPEARFRIVAQAPDVEVVIDVLAGGQRPAPGAAVGEDPPSFVPFVLTPTQRTIGAAVIAPLLAGRPRRAGYVDIAVATHYAERTVREAVAAMDGLFIVHRLVEPRAASDALDRVAHTLRIHPSLLGEGSR